MISQAKKAMIEPKANNSTGASDNRRDYQYQTRLRIPTVNPYFINVQFFLNAVNILT